MMFSFDPDRGLIVIRARISGPRGSTVVRLALDTGATHTMSNWNPVILMSYDPATAPDRAEVATASGIEFSPQLLVSQIEALGRTRRDFTVLCHTLPPSTTVDGLLGLDFFRGSRLSIDFREGTISVD
jgi:hypothetical protein